MAARTQHWSCKMIYHSMSLFLIDYPPNKQKDLVFWKIVDWSFQISCLLGFHTLLLEKFASFYHHKMMLGLIRQISRKSLLKKLSRCLKILYMKQLRVLKTAGYGTRLVCLVEKVSLFDKQNCPKFKAEVLVKWKVPIEAL